MNNPNLNNLENIIKALNQKLQEEAHRLQEKDAQAKALLEENKKLTQQIETNKQTHSKLENEIRLIKSEQEKIHREVTESQRHYTDSLKSFKDIKLK